MQETLRFINFFDDNSVSVAPTMAENYHPDNQTEDVVRLSMSDPHPMDGKFCLNSYSEAWDESYELAEKCLYSCLDRLVTLC